MDHVLSAQTQTVINSVIDRCLTTGLSIELLGQQLTKDQLVNYISTTSRALLETQIANRSLAKSLVCFLHELNKCGGREHYQIIRDRVKSDYNMTVNDYSSLRYWGLITPIDFEDQTGFWKITEDGNKFLNNESRLPKNVSVHNNRVIKRSNELVGITDFDDLDFVGYQKIKKQLAATI